MTSSFPLNKDQLTQLVQQHPTPFHLYDEKAMLDNVARLHAAFAWNTGFKEYFAVKATPNPFLLKLLLAAGLGMDCSALAELELADMCGAKGEEIMFTSNNTPAIEYQRARDLGAIINLDDITHLSYLQREVGLPELLSFRLNPGDLLGGSEIIGKPKEAKFGLTVGQLFEAYRAAKSQGVKRFGLHTMPISNELDRTYFVRTVELLLDIVLQAHQEIGIDIEFINMGGGIGIPYRPEQVAVDLEWLGSAIRDCFHQKLSSAKVKAPKLFMECGRFITGPYGSLVTRAIHKKETYRNYIGVDASMADLMRPGMYGAYHHISVVGKEGDAPVGNFDVVGSLCENNDKFAIQRPLPKIDQNDFIVIHDAGAHGHSMGFNYNGKTRAAELLLRPNGEVVQIRRKETLQDIFATLDLTKVAQFS
jgi:diaminopimelate decarboxylase